MLEDTNKFNQYLNKCYHVNSKEDVIIKGVMPRIILSKEEQKQIIKEIGVIKIKKDLGENPTLLEQLSLAFLFEGTY